MGKDVYEPFNKDVEEGGGYVYADEDRATARYANRRFSTVIVNVLDYENKRVVDVGCGDGTYTKILHDETKAASILGTDPASVAIERASEKYADDAPRLTFANKFSTDLIEAGEHFDIAIYRGVIHHVGNAAEEIANAMQLADQVFFLEPNGWNPVLKMLEKFSPYHRDHEEQSFLLSQYHRWIREAGGEPMQSFFFGLVPMFSPDYFVTLGSALEPVVERIPLLRRVGCGQIGILARGRI